MATKLVDSLTVGAQLCNVLGLDPNEVTRIILDVHVGEPVVVYVQMYGSLRLLDIDWASVTTVIRILCPEEEE